jgi:NAD(P)H-flavin reductase
VGGKIRGILVSKLVADAWPAPGPDRLPLHFTGWTLAGEYRVVPSAPAYEVSLAGRIRYIETMREPIIRDDRGRDRVYICGREVMLQTLINEAWPECAREPVRTRRKYLGDGEYAPLPTYPDGRIVTVQQYRRDLELSRRRA